MCAALLRLRPGARLIEIILKSKQECCCDQLCLMLVDGIGTSEQRVAACLDEGDHAGNSGVIRRC